jgi:predicted site-specific integrase-resolvase
MGEVKNFFNFKEAAAFLEMSYETFRRYRNNGVIPQGKLPNRYNRQELEAIAGLARNESNQSAHA